MTPTSPPEPIKPASTAREWARLIELGWIVHDKGFRVTKAGYCVFAQALGDLSAAVGRFYL